MHIVDNYFWGVSGIGGGVEHINMGPSKLLFALIQDTVDESSNDQDNVTGVIVDIRYAGFLCGKRLVFPTFKCPHYSPIKMSPFKIINCRKNGL